MVTRKAGKIFVGVGGWNFAPWRGSFYPKGLTQPRELHYASRELTSIEINSTFYGLQKPATFQKWHDETPDGFVFSVKAPRFVTQRKNLAESASSITRFLESGVLQLGAKLGAINWQLPPTMSFDVEDWAHSSHCCHASWKAAHYVTPSRRAIRVSIARNFALAREHEVAIVEAGDSEYPRIEARTATFSYYA
jgi:uncharacterized protein YecE (DUF72 family)